MKKQEKATYPYTDLDIIEEYNGKHYQMVIVKITPGRSGQACSMCCWSESGACTWPHVEHLKRLQGCTYIGTAPHSTARVYKEIDPLYHDLLKVKELTDELD